MQIPFKIEQQRRSNWCWAAIASSISDYYSPEANWCQCRLASEMLGRRPGGRRKNCCQRLSGKLLDECNQEWHLHRALRVIGQSGGKPLFRRLSFREIQTNIHAGFPIAARMEWSDGNGHFVVIIGCNQSRNGDKWVYVEDPLHGHGTWRYDVFCKNYQYAEGCWNVTFPLKGQKFHAHR